MYKSIEVMLEPVDDNLLITLAMKKEAGQLSQSGLEAQDKTFVRRGDCVGILGCRNRRSVRTVNEHVERY